MHLITPSPDATSDDALVRRARPLLGTIVEIAVDADSSHLFDVAFDAIAHIHSRMSFHEDDSDISAMARAPAKTTLTLDPHTIAVLRLAENLHRRTQGVFDITVGKTLVQSGFLPHKGEQALSYYDGSVRDIEILSDTQVHLHRPVLIDLGGIAKGYAVDFAVDRLQASGAKFGIVNAGGDLRVFGDHEADVDIRQTDGSLSTRRLKNAAIASSENTHARRNRLWSLQTPHIGPSGKSIRIDKTLSVIANQCVVADALTKVAMLDVVAANEFAADYDGYVVGHRGAKPEPIAINKRSARLASWQTRLLSISGAVLWLSGALWLYLHYFSQVEGEFGLETHPLESWLLRAHGLVLVPALLGIGGLFVAHMPIGWKNRGQRITGVLLGTLLATIVLTGYLLYYAGGDQLRAWSSVIHWTIGLAIPGLYIWHRYERRARLAGES